MVPLSQSNGVFVEELKKELGEGHFLYHKKVWAVAKCESNDDVLYLTAGEQGGDTYYIFHLTYSKQNLITKRETIKGKIPLGYDDIKEYVITAKTENLNWQKYQLANITIEYAV